MTRKVFLCRLRASALSLFVLLIHNVALQAQTGRDVFQATSASLFLPPVPYGVTGFDASGLAVSDVTGDGKVDLVVGTGNGLNVLAGNGDGTFQSPVFHSTVGMGASSIAIADVNRDGIPDLIASNVGPCGTHSDGCIAVLIGQGAGNFRAAKGYDAGGVAATSLTVADFNGDGNPDIAVTNCTMIGAISCGQFGLLMGRGDGTFTKVVTHNSGGIGAWAITNADVNGDGNADLVISNLCQDANCDGPGSVAVLLGRGNGRFQTPVTYSSGGRTLFSSVADVNGDGVPDLVVANGAGEEGVGVLLGNGNGTFQPVVIYKALQKYVSSLTIGDVDGDGRPDVVVADCAMGMNVCQVTASVGVLLGNGDGTFQTATTYSSGGQPSNFVAVVDLNGDGHNDVAVTNCAPAGGSCDGSQNGVVSVLINTGQ